MTISTLVRRTIERLAVAVVADKVEIVIDVAAVNEA
jgi:hypothetical protein